MPLSVRKSAALLLVAGLASACRLEPRSYVAARLGPAIAANIRLPATGNQTRAVRASHGLGVSTALAVGRSFDVGLRAELELSYRDTPTDELRVRGFGPGGAFRGTSSLRGDTRASALMLNLLYELETDSGVRPYLGIGGGGAHVAHRSTSERRESDETGAFQILGGVAFPFTDRVSVEVGYRFFRSNANFGPGYAIDFEVHSLDFALRYVF